MGLEPTLADYIAGMVAVFRELRRVLRDDGTCWVNMGDSYNAGTSAKRKAPKTTVDVGGWMDAEIDGGARVNERTLKPKDLMMVPARLAIALCDDGWWLRKDIIWHKPNPMPESITDRPTSSHEHILLLAKSERYFFDAEAVRETQVSDRPDMAVKGVRTGLAYLQQGPTADNSIPRRPKGNAKTFRGGVYTGGRAFDNGEPMERDSRGNEPNLTGTRNIRDVWTIATAPFPEAHFATFPSELPERCIKAGTSERGCCPGCGAPWVRVVETRRQGASWINPKTAKEITTGPIGGGVGANRLGPGVTDQRTTTGWSPTCSCPPAVPVPCTVLDPFLGAGTTALVADRLGRDCVGIELNPEYAAMARRRIEADAGLFAAVAD